MSKRLAILFAVQWKLKFLQGHKKTLWTIMIHLTVRFCNPWVLKQEWEIVREQKQRKLSWKLYNVTIWGFNKYGYSLILLSSIGYYILSIRRKLTWKNEWTPNHKINFLLFNWWVIWGSGRDACFGGFSFSKSFKRVNSYTVFKTMFEIE